MKTLRLTVLAFLVANCAFGDLAAHYTFDDSGDRYADVSGNGYDGTIDGSGTTFVSSGIPGLGDAMHSTEASRVLVNTPITEVSLSSFAISFWATSAAAAWDNWISFGGTDNFALEQYDTGPAFFLDNVANIPGYADYGISASFGAGLNHVVLSADSSMETIVLYINGTQADTGAWTVSPSETLGYLTIGGSRDITVRNIDATIDDVQIYDTALSAGDASYLYANPGSVVPEPATLGLFAFVSVIGFFIRRRFMI